MPLTTASLPELRDRSNAALRALDTTLAKLQAPTLGERCAADPLPARVLQRIDRVFDHRLKIERAASTAAQREHYGIARWSAEWVRLAELTPPEGWRSDETTLRSAACRLLRGSKFLRFQELFCDPHNIIVPHLSLDARGALTFRASFDAKTASVLPCLVSPDRVPDELLERLRLVRWSKQERRQPLLRFLRKSDPALLERFKEMWDQALPLGSNDMRVFAVQRLKGSSSMALGVHGTLLYTREDLTSRVQRIEPLLGPRRVYPLQAQHFVTIFDAHRKTLHARRGYDEEQTQLVELHTKIGLVLNRLTNEWRRDADFTVKEEIRGQVRETLTEGLKLLEKAADGKKRYAHSLLEKVVETRDSLGRTNPSVTASRMSHALRELKERLDETYEKNSYNERDRKLLKELMQRDGTVLRSVRFVLQERAEAAIAGSRLFSGAQLEPQRERPDEVARVLRMVMPNVRALEELRCRPFSTFAGLLRIGYGELSRALEAQDRDAAEKTLVKMFVVTKMSAATTVVERCREQCVEWPRVPISSMLAGLRDIEGIFAAQIFPHVRLPEIERRFDSLVENVHELRGRLEAAQERRDAVRVSQPLHAELRTFFEEIRPERLAWEMVPAEWRAARRASRHATVGASRGGSGR